ncbi:PaaI family thioesterase [Streptomyces sp. SID3343]|uniref:PaaI family thioesterase n=1 Tax=Streptomyces sp. SID3343 TaxID=2690260 RepID=UPI00136C0103|nr:PaaI family thioesterase [Streptomyces sp. SID3343]MYW01833.1 PaaI family thioesterase [Streptomyces sp. SID3343]
MNSNTQPLPPASATALAEMMAGALPAPSTVTTEALDLADRVRDLVEAVVMTDVDAAVRADAAERIAELTRVLGAARRDQAVSLVRHEDGRLEHLTQMGSGRLNPQAPRLVFDDVPARPDVRADPEAVEVHARCTLTAAHGGPPARAHGGIVAVILDQLLGVAASAAGAPGLTAGLDIRYRKATPYGVPLELTGRWTGREGRKSFATGEIRANGEVTAEATAVFIAERRS